MSLSTLLLALLVLSSLAFYLGRKKALSAAGGNLRTLHSLPNYYGYYLALWAGIPALAVFTLWLVLEPQIVQSLVVGGLPEAQRNLSPGRLGLLINDIRNLASGNIVSREVAPGLQEAADHYVRLRDTSRIALFVPCSRLPSPA